MKILARIICPYFCAGLILENDMCIKAAPIIKYMVGWDREAIRDYCARKDFKISVVEKY